MKRIKILFIVYIIGTNLCQAQLPHTFTQYTSENGLSQKTVQSIIQDHKGLMWFATWDGLYKFDGYSFKNYKAHPGDNIRLTNNRMDIIKEDTYGYIWVQSYDHLIFRFDPRSEKFQPIPYENYLAEDIYVLRTGDVWVTTSQKELIHITTNPITHEMTAKNFFKVHQIPYQEQVNKIFLDHRHQQWILTENGLYKLTRYGNKEQLSSYFVAPPKTEKNSFFDILECGENLFFTSLKGSIWRLTNDQFTQKEFPTSSSVKFIQKITKNKLFIGTATDGFFIYDRKADKTSHYNTTTCKNLKSNNIKEVYIDSHHEIWLRLNTAGAVHFNPQTERIDNFILKDKYGKDIIDSRFEMYIYEDINGSLWLHPSGGGLAWYDRKNNKIHSFYNPHLQSGWSSDNKVTGLFTDKQGNLWLCSYGNGLEKITFNKSHFNLLNIHPKDSEFPGNNTRAVYQDRNGYIWVGNKDKIIRVYDKKMKYMGNLTSQGRVIPNSMDQLGMAYSFTQDYNGVIWIGTKGNGLIAATPSQLPLSFNIQQYTANTDNIHSLSGNNIYSLHEDSQHRLWIATFEGGINYLDLKVKPQQFINYRNRLKNYPIGQCYRTRFVTSSPKGDVWIGSTTGLLMCKADLMEPEQITFRQFSRIPSDVNSLSNNDVHSIFFSRKEEMYISTFGGGFNKLLSLDDKQAKFKSYTMKDGLSSDIILSIEEDNKGNLWLATEEELCKFTPATENIENYSAKAFPMHINFNEGDALRTQDGQLMFNTARGVLHFSPDSISSSKYIPPLIFTNFQQAEQIITPEKGGILTTNIDDTELIKLPHDRNGFSIQFAALDMRYPNSISYAYQLEGFEKNWNYIGNQRTATYTNLPKGSYTLKVKSTNSDGVWVENTRSLNLIVQPSFWETVWAYLLYILSIIFIIFCASYILFTIFRLKHKVIVEQQISDIKLRFFTNISHELRTPLTLIAGPIEHILQNGHLNHEEKEQLILVERNTNRMLRLVNQILDFRKIQNKKMKMRVQLIDLIPFTRHVMENFNSLADEHQIDFKLSTQLYSLSVWADTDKLEKILFNLLSNAFKYTPQGKLIKVTITESDKDVAISVQDQGIGIAENKQKSLFVRFENIVDKNLFNQNHYSSGIGLSLVKELIEMHQGTITFQSQLGEGSQFTITLRKGKEHFDDATEFILTDHAVTDIEQVFQTLQLTSLNQSDSEELDKEKESILIVEDNPELRFFLKTIFSPYFNVIEAENGKIGLEKGKNYQPDIIVSDIMMPEMDGIEMTHALRDEITTSHIPIVLLTAKSNIESKIEGMKLGADDYITKPFSAAYLKARIFNLLEQRKKLQALFCASLLTTSSEQQELEQIKETQLEKEVTPFFSPNDKKFMDKVLETIDKNLDNGELMVEDIASEVNMSRSVFFKKLKTLTGLSPIELLKEIRMKRAAQFIETNEYNMAQIAYMVGVNDSHYFSKCFKQQYGMTPTEYKESKKTGE